VRFLITYNYQSYQEMQFFLIERLG
jgi:hypothetical protein